MSGNRYNTFLSSLSRAYAEFGEEHTLNLSGIDGGVNEEHFDLIFQVLRENPQITHLVLPCDHFKSPANAFSQLASRLSDYPSDTSKSPVDASGDNLCGLQSVELANWHNMSKTQTGDTIKALARALRTRSLLNKKLILPDSIIDQASAAALAKELNHRCLEELDLSYSTVDFDGVGKLASALPGHPLKKLVLRRIPSNSATVESIVKLLKEGSIEELDLSYTQITDEHMKMLAGALAHNSSLQKLDLSGNNVSAASIKNLAQALKSNKSLENLRLPATSSAGIQYLANTLSESRNTSLKKLGLCGSTIDKTAAQSIANMLRNSSIKDLNLARCRIKDRAIAIIADSLTKNNTLESLNLSCTGIDTTLQGINAIEALTRALSNNTSLQKLDLSDNIIRYHSAKSIADMLKNNSGIHDLDLADCDIGHDEALFIVRSLPANKTLQNLNLNNNRIGDNVIHEVGAALNKNQSLQKLSLRSKNAFPLISNGEWKKLRGTLESTTLKKLSMDVSVQESFMSPFYVSRNVGFNHEERQPTLKMYVTSFNQLALEGIANYNSIPRKSSPISSFFRESERGVQRAKIYSGILSDTTLSELTRSIAVYALLASYDGATLKNCVAKKMGMTVKAARDHLKQCILVNLEAEGGDKNTVNKVIGEIVKYANSNPKEISNEKITRILSHLTNGYHSKFQEDHAGLSLLQQCVRW